MTNIFRVLLAKTQEQMKNLRSVKKQLSLVIPFVKVTEIQSIIFFSSLNCKREMRIVS